MYRLAFITMILAVLLLSSCSSGAAVPNPIGPAQLAGLTTLPDLPHVASSAEMVNGVDSTAAGPGATDDDPAVLLDAAGLTCSWAMYSFGAFEEMILNSLHVDVENVTGEFWVGLSNYGNTNAWEFQGPFTTDTDVSLAGIPGTYTSPLSSNLHWVVVADGDSNLRVVSSTVDYDLMGMPLFYVPPTGMQIIATPPATDPTLVIMTNAPSVAEEGAPVIFYTAGDGISANTHMAWYNGAEWENRVLDGTKRYTMARAHWTGSEGVIVCYYNGAGGIEDPSEIRLLYTDAEWLINTTDSVNMGGPHNRIPTMLAMDHDDATHRTAAIHAYVQDLMPPQVQVSMVTDVGGSNSGDLAVVGDIYGGVDIAFDPDPMDDGGWAMYSSGTYDTTDILLLDFQIKYARLSDMTWDWEAENYIDYNSPMAIDLHYAPDGVPRLLMISARDMSIPFTDITASLYYDAVLGTFNGAGWDFEDIFTSSIAIHIFAQNMDVDLGVDVSWAASDALHFANVEGTVDFSLSPEFAITGGNLANNANYMTETAGEFSSSPYFTGDPGITHSWAAGPNGPACAYINVEQVDVDDVLSGDLSGIAADLVYWSP